MANKTNSNNNKYKHRKGKKSKKYLHRKKTKLNKKKLIVSILLSVVVVFTVVFVSQKAFGFVSKTWPNVIFIKNTLLGRSVDKTDVDTNEQFDLEDEQQTTLEKKHNVFIDVGCGGAETGYVADDKTMEKDLNLQIAKLVAKRLSKESDINVIMSRQEDIYKSVEDRKADAQRENAEVFVSIHMAGESTGQASGIQTIHQKSDDVSSDLAQIVQTSMSAYVKARNRGKVEYNMSILRDNSIPSIYIQCGFLSNKSELKNLKDQKYQADLAEGIAQGIMTYIDAKK